jgi:hypothetical protein
MTEQSDGGVGRLHLLLIWMALYVAEVNSRPMASACSYSLHAIGPWVLGGIYIMLVGRYPTDPAKYLGWQHPEEQMAKLRLVGPDS